MIVDVLSVTDGAMSNGIPTEIPDFESLATLARYCERPILREKLKGSETYAVEDGGRLFIHHPVASPLRPVLAPVEPALPPTKSGTPRGRPLVKPVGLLLGVVVAATLVTAFTAANTVPVSYAGTSNQPSSLSQIAPLECGGLGLTNLIAMTTASTAGTTANDLILGKNMSGAVTISGGGGNDCLIGGGGAGTTNKFDGGGGTTDICIGAPGATNQFNHCEQTY